MESIRQIFILQFLYLLIFIIPTLHTKEIENLNHISMSNLEGEPSAFVHNCVNVISGQYCVSQTDLVAYHGVNPITVERVFFGTTLDNGILGPGWALNHFSEAKVKTYHSGSSHPSVQIGVILDHGAELKFGKKFSSKSTVAVDIPLNENCISQGVTNNASGYLSAKTNIKNLSFEIIDNKSSKMLSGSGSRKIFQNLYGDDKEIQRISEERLPNGNIVSYNYHCPHISNYLSTVEIINKLNKKTGCLSFTNLSRKNQKKDKLCWISAEGKHDVKYHFKKIFQEYLLNKVERSDGPSEEYDYSNVQRQIPIKKETPDYFTWLDQREKEKNKTFLEKLREESEQKSNNTFSYCRISKKRQPLGRYLAIDYYNHSTKDLFDPYADRVKTLWAPAGSDNTPIPIYFFEYNLNSQKNSKHPQKNKVLNGCCRVYDALKNKTEYEFDVNHRLISIEKFRDTTQSYSKEVLFWGDDYDDSRLKARLLKSQDGNTIFARTYSYDKVGNVIEEALYGNLTGDSKFNIPQFDSQGLPKGTNTPCYIKFFEYSKDGLNLLCKESDGNQTVTYKYYKGTDLLAAKYQGSDQKFYRRWFYTYNEDGALIKEIIDDGNAIEEANLSGVTQRLIIRHIQSKQYPVAFPLTTEEKYLDLKTKKEVLIHKIVNSYSLQGKIKQQDHYDNKGIFAYSLSWDYDNMGNIIKEKNALGHTINRKFDEFGNCIYEQGPCKDFHKVFHYDYMNRLYKEEEIHKDGITHVLTHQYNFASQRTATVDTYGNETLYKNDALGRVIEIIHPLVIDDNEKPYHPVVKRNYDVLGHVISEIDTKGFETKKNYTIRGQEYLTSYPDGSSEKKLYDLYGFLIETQAKNNTRTVYTNDPLGRPCITEIFDKNGKLLQKTTASYSGFNILTETDPKGIQTIYDYYPDGKLKSKQKANNRTSYIYDSLGRIAETREHFGPLREDFIIKARKCDLLNRVTEEEVKDLKNVFTRISYNYDIQGNVSKITTYPHGKKAITVFKYDSHGQLICLTDSENNKTTTKYYYDFLNNLKQFVPYKEVTNPNGNMTITIQDAMGRDNSVTSKNTKRKTLQQQKFLYDRGGNCSVITDIIIAPDSTQRENITHFEYDNLNRLKTQYEAVGTPEQKKTTLLYNRFGQKETIIKADGVRLNHSYDALGRLSKLISSDGTINYIYHYDLNGNAHKVEDCITKTFTQRKYDENDCVYHERQAHGLTLTTDHDFLGRPAKITLPDCSAIEYRYQAIFMNKVTRYDAQSKMKYMHVYDKYDMSGNLLQATLIGDAGKINYLYDNLGRIKTIKTNNWQETIANYDCMGNILEKTLIDKLTTTNRYTYDGLNQIASETGGILKNTYQHDSHFNRIKKNGKQQKLNMLHQLVNDGTFRYSYDQNGNLKQKTSSKQSTTYVYDALDRLASLINENEKVCYLYDDTNRRFRKLFYNKNNKEEWQLTKTINFLYQGQNEIGTCDNKGKILQLRVLGHGKGAEIGAAVAIESDSDLHIPLHDNNGNVAALLCAEDGQLVESYHYTAFGEENFENYSIPWRFASKRYDEESDLIYFGRRYYNPSTGCWLTPDPLGREGGPNLYAYVLNRPLTHFDLYGLIGESSSNLYNQFMSADFKKLASNSSDSAITGKIYSKSSLDGPPIVFSEHLLFKNEINCRNPETHCVGSQISSEKGLFFTNGVNTSLEYAKGHAAMLSEMAGGHSVNLTYNPTNGLTIDSRRYCLSKNFYASKTVMELQRNWDNFFNNSSSSSRIMQTCHSEGAVNVRNALICYDNERRKRIYVLAIAPGAYIDDKYCGQIVHYSSKRDFVPRLDIDGRSRNLHNTIALEPHKDASWWDHDFRSPTYEIHVRQEISLFLNSR